MVRKVKITIEAYGKTFKIDPRKYCGYIKCDRTQKVIPISNEAVPLQTEKGISFVCACGKHVYNDVWYHRLYYKGKEIKYGY